MADTAAEAFRFLRGEALAEDVEAGGRHGSGPEAACVGAESAEWPGGATGGVLAGPNATPS